MFRGGGAMKHATHSRSVAWVLMQVRIGRQLRLGEREDIVFRVERRSGLGAALPRPHVTVPREFAEPDQVHPPLGFPQELAATLGENRVEWRKCREVTARSPVPTLPNGIQV